MHQRLETRIQWVYDGHQRMADTTDSSGIENSACEPRDMRCSWHKRRLERPIEGERASIQGELDKEILKQTCGLGDPDETASATTVAKRPHFS
ncbi:hypothetical protein AMTRI_Chr04g183610 [Amborella trichopoda]